MKKLRGSIVALVTPFENDGGIDYPALSQLINFHLENGTSGILVNGTTAESPCITLEEFDSITKFVVDQVNGAIPVIAGTGSNSTDQAIIRSQIAEYNGVDGLLVVSPYYNKPTAKGLLEYFGSIATSTSLPIIIYNVPGRTASNIPTDIILELARRHRTIIGIKEASGSMEKIMDLIQNRPSGFLVYSGDDSLALNTVLIGGDGCISVVANQIPKVFSQMLNAGLNGEIEIARNLHYKYYELMKLNFIETNPIPVKTALHQMGLISLNFRSPMCTMEEENEAILSKELNNLSLTSSKRVKEFILE
ncbi:4-hydroxy-tetrahydrodipicolinate synthase [Portibacter lacus]|uniref:4-hydroxy-tetrahydrodipicolinate synthase n=1 Tax=Portibacter lacus TaxID=1099794 RepID=A0AA37WGB2_9BACT|nr:4-hydroxy-tetrahydrodipicolinate synthase [Portibacter lacus]GLR17805.1 4-hydroxy-tetrahydrodipicolinate synthase [Portibacter lacus]